MNGTRIFADKSNPISVNPLHPRKSASHFLGTDRFQASQQGFQALHHRFQALQHGFQVLHHRFQVLHHRFQAV